METETAPLPVVVVASILADGAALVARLSVVATSVVGTSVVETIVVAGAPLTTRVVAGA